MTYKIVADDYGMSTGINRVISELIGRSIISKVSVMSNESAEYAMNDIKKNVMTGLHVNLTVGTGKNDGQNNSFLRLIYLVYSNKLSIKQIRNNIRHQTAFLRNRGFEFSYLDTHHHIHIIPKVLKALILHAKTEGIRSIRCITMEKKYCIFYFYSLMRFGFMAQVPKMTFLYFAGLLMKARLDSAGITYCKNLILMPLATKGDYAGLLGSFIDKFESADSEIVTHPGPEAEIGGPDDYTGRFIEYRSLLSLTGRNFHRQ